MTTLDYATLSLPRYLAMRIASKEGERTRRASIPRTWVQSMMKVVMTLAGFACLTIAGFTFNMIAGWIIAGASCMVLAWLIGGQSAPATPDERLTR
jgi:uncharacterized protein involved in cysteine biosynthesis